MKEQLPGLYFHLRRIGLTLDFFGTQWFMTMFSRILPLECTVKLWSMFFLKGWKVFFRAALVIMHRLKEKLTAMEDLESASSFFRLCPKMQSEELAPDDLFPRFNQFKVTRSILSQMKSRYEVQVLQVRLNGNALQLNIAGIVPSEGVEKNLDKIRQDIGAVDSSISSDSAVFRQKIENAQKSCTAKTIVYLKSRYRLTEAYVAVHDLEEIKNELIDKLHSCKAAASSKEEACGTVAVLRPKTLIERISQHVITLQARRSNNHKADEKARVAVPEKEMEHYSRKLSRLSKKLDSARYSCVLAQEEYTLAKTEMEEKIEFKDRCCEQFLQFLEETEKNKIMRMTKLFAEIDSKSNTPTEIVEQ